MIAMHRICLPLFLLVFPSVLEAAAPAAGVSDSGVERHVPHRRSVLVLEDGVVVCRHLPVAGSRADRAARLEAARSVGPPLVVRHAADHSTWEVVYHDFHPQAQAAFQRAVEIWARHVSSPVTIRVEAHFTPMGEEGFLGWAGPDAFFNHGGSPIPLLRDNWVPAALADMAAEVDLDGESGDPDIYAEFNSDFGDWYFGLDGAPPFESYDFLTVVLHELGHGLGFIDSVEPVPGGQLAWGFDGVPRVPVPFDRFMVDGEGFPLIGHPSGSAEFTAAMTSNDLYYDGWSTVEAAGDQQVPLYAPAVFAYGSSVAHLNEWTYPAPSGHSLMTPTVYNGEAEHDPGSIMFGMMRDMGWRIMELLHFAQFAAGGGISSDIVLTNPSPLAAAAGSVRLYDADGAPIAPGDVIPGGVVDFVLPPLATQTLSTRSTGNLVIGSAVVSADRPIFGVIRFDLTGTGVAGVGSSVPVREAALPVRRKGALSTGAAVRNVTLEQIQVELRLLRGNGSLATAPVFRTLDPEARLAEFIHELFPGVDTADFEGTLAVRALSGRIGVIGLELEPGSRFTTLPVSKVRSSE
jgi:hypothetical protein